MKRAARGIWLTGAALLAVYPIGALALWAAGYKMEMRFPQFYLGAAAFLLVLGAVLTRMESQTRLCKAAAIFSVVAGILVGLFVGLTTLFSNFGHTEVLKTLVSPSETFAGFRWIWDSVSFADGIAAFIPGRGAKGRK